MCGQRFVQAVVSLVLIVESSHTYQNVATGVYFNLKKKSSRFFRIWALKFYFRQLWFFEILKFRKPTHGECKLRHEDAKL